jgi:hypothetical protein
MAKKDEASKGSDRPGLAGWGLEEIMGLSTFGM